MPQSETMKIKLLVHGTHHGKKDEVVEVPVELGREMVRKHERLTFLGEKYTHQVAMSLDEVEAQDRAIAEIPMDQLTQAEARRLGRKNIVQSEGGDGTVSAIAKKIASEKKTKKTDSKE